MRRNKKKKIKRVMLVVVLVIILIFSSVIFLKKVNNINDEKIENITPGEEDNNEIIEEDDDNDESRVKTYDDVSMLQYEDGTILERLNLFSKKDKRIKKIIENYDKYPEKLMEALSRNIELTDFVLNYQSKKDKVYSEDIGNLESGVVPLLYQWDERWGYGKYGTSNIAISGCGPTSLAMVIAYLKNDNTITPYKIAKLAEEKGFYKENSGTTWDLMRKGPASYGVKVKEIALSKNVIYNALKNGHPIICNMRKGDFTINGHYLVLSSIVDDKIKINDPNSKERSSMLWEYDRIKSQIKNLWEFYL